MVGKAKFLGTVYNNIQCVKHTYHGRSDLRSVDQNTISYINEITGGLPEYANHDCFIVKSRCVALKLGSKHCKVFSCEVQNTKVPNFL